MSIRYYHKQLWYMVICTSLARTNVASDNVFHKCSTAQNLISLPPFGELYEIPRDMSQSSIAAFMSWTTQLLASRPYKQAAGFHSLSKHGMLTCPTRSQESNSLSSSCTTGAAIENRLGLHGLCVQHITAYVFPAQLCCVWPSHDGVIGRGWGGCLHVDGNILDLII